MPPVPNRVPVQGGKPMTVSQTVSKWAEHLVEEAKSKAAKKIGVDKKPEAPAPVLADTPGTLAYAWGNQPDNPPLKGRSFKEFSASRKPKTIGEAWDEAIQADNTGSHTGPTTREDAFLDALFNHPDFDPTAFDDDAAFDKMHDLPLPKGLKYAYGEGPREGEDDSMVSDFFFTESDKEAQARHESAKRQQKRTQDRVNPTSTSKFRQLERVAYSTRSFQIDRYVAPPGMESVVKRLKGKHGISNPYAVAWSMYERDKHTQDRSIGGLTRIGALEGALQRSLRVLDAVGEGHYGVSKEVIERLHSDALEDLDRSFERDDPLREAWRHVVDQARNEALGSINRHSEQGPAKIEAIEEREPEFPRDVMLEEMTGKGTGLKKKTECYWLYRR